MTKAIADIQNPVFKDSNTVRRSDNGECAELFGETLSDRMQAIETAENRSELPGDAEKQIKHSSNEVNDKPAPFEREASRAMEETGEKPAAGARDINREKENSKEAGKTNNKIGLKNMNQRTDSKQKPSKEISCTEKKRTPVPLAAENGRNLAVNPQQSERAGRQKDIAARKSGAASPGLAESITGNAGKSALTVSTQKPIVPKAPQKEANAEFNVQNDVVGKSIAGNKKTEIPGAAALQNKPVFRKKAQPYVADRQNAARNTENVKKAPEEPRQNVLGRLSSKPAGWNNKNESGYKLLLSRKNIAENAAGTVRDSSLADSNLKEPVAEKGYDAGKTHSSGKRAGSEAGDSRGSVRENSTYMPSREPNVQGTESGKAADAGIATDSVSPFKTEMSKSTQLSGFAEIRQRPG